MNNILDNLNLENLNIKDLAMLLEILTKFTNVNKNSNNNNNDIEVI